MTVNLPVRVATVRNRRFPISAGHWVLELLEARTCLSATLPTATPAQSPAEIIAQANNDFALNLFQELNNNSGSGNVFFSPYSVATALEMLLQGAKGTTASEIIQTLDLPSSDIANAGIQALYQLFQANPATSGYTLSTANRLWINDNFPVLQSFLTSEQNIMGASPQTVDFSDPTTAANTINTWVSDQTNGKIQNLISPSMVDAFTALVLTNAVYFKGNWASAFNPQLTQAATFQNSSTQTSTVQMMQQTNDFGYDSQSGPNGYQSVDLPYQGGNLDMVVILPTASNLSSFESSLTPDEFSQITSNFSTTNVDLSLPRFTLNETYDLSGPLQEMGIQTAFTPEADFSGISPQGTQVSFVVQKSFISVDETGTEAAAATGIGVTDSVVMVPPPPVTFDANHPFLFAIVDHSTGTMLFLGSITDPGDDTAAAMTPVPTSPSNPSSPNNPVVPSTPVAPSTPNVAAATHATSSAAVSPFASGQPISATQELLGSSDNSNGNQSILE